MTDFRITGTRVSTCAYGENPWQRDAALYTTDDTDVLALHRFELIAGNPMSYNNCGDVDRLLQTITHTAAVFHRSFSRVPHIAIGVKHGNACGAGVHHADPHAALKRMLTGDTLAIFGGLVMTNFPIGDIEAELIRTWGMEPGEKRLLDSVIAPSFTQSAIHTLARSTGKCRLLANAHLERVDAGSLDTARRFRYVRGGFLVQPNYTFVPDMADEDLVRRAYVGKGLLLRDLALSWAIGSTSNSNTITLVKDGKLLANAVGQQDRVGAAKLAVMRAERQGHALSDAAAYSDSFFPFTDGPATLIAAGITSILTSSGSVNDEKVIHYCALRNVSLLMIDDKAGRGFFGH
jgi:phosphoribosylaminoimidazolecarboxamide formyltransferase/IMP cyclohydrolase